MLTVHGEPLTLCAPCHSVPVVIHPHHFTAFLFTLPTGHLPFHTIAKLSTVRRKRRDVEAEGSSNKLAFSLSLSNVTHSFDMSPSTDILSPRYVLEEVAEDGRLVTVPSTVKDCYYIQDIRQTGLSAVTVCSHTVVSSVPYCTVHAPCVGCAMYSLLTALTAVIRTLVRHLRSTEHKHVSGHSWHMVCRLGGQSSLIQKGSI